MVVVEGNDETKKIQGLCLYHFAASNASQKVRGCLEAKNLKWTSRIVSVDEMTSDWYFSIHPKGLVPALVHDGVTHIESADILVYLDEAFPEVPLRPATKEGKQEVQSWLDLESFIQKSMKYLTFKFLFGLSSAKFIETDERLARLKVKNPEGYAFHKQVRDGTVRDKEVRGHIEKIHDALAILETRLENHKWLVGDQISLAEYCWGPNVYRYMESYMLRFPVGRYPAVQAWYGRLFNDQAFQKGVITYGNVFPKPVLAIKNWINEFLGYSLMCFEREVKPNWAPALMLSVALPLCSAFLPYAAITSATGVSSTMASTCLAGLWVFVIYSCYKKAHKATKSVYFSDIHHMRALLLNAYGRETLTCGDHPRPKVILPDDVLVKIHAASINPIDCKMKEGYGKTVMNFLRGKAKIPVGNGKEFPLILGKDCSGVVEGVGESVSHVKVGDEVWGSLSVVPTPGTWAEYAMFNEGAVAKKPKSLTHTEAVALTYVAMTTWGALVKAAGLGPENTAGKRVLILAGTGGIGSFAIQLVKAWGGHVTTSCSTSGRAMVEKLGADEVVDYTQTDLESALKDKPRFDVVLDTLGPASYQACLNLCKRGGCVVTLVSPAPSTLDEYGFVLGLPKAMFDLFRISIPQKLLYGRRFKYSFVAPSTDALDVIARLAEQNKIKPIVEKVFSLEDGNKALEHVLNGHARGKTVLVMRPDE